MRIEKSNLKLNPCITLCQWWVSDRPGCELSEGQGVVVGQGGRAEDDASILRVSLQHALSLLPSHIQETPAGTTEKHKHFLIEGNKGAGVLFQRAIN